MRQAFIVSKFESEEILSTRDWSEELVDSGSEILCCVRRTKLMIYAAILNKHFDGNKTQRETMITLRVALLFWFCGTTPMSKKFGLICWDWPLKRTSHGESKFLGLPWRIRYPLNIRIKLLDISITANFVHITTLNQSVCWHSLVFCVLAATNVGFVC